MLDGNLNKIFFKYLFAAIGSALIVSVYSLVDMVCVGQYEGPIGSAALAIVLPCFSIIISLGLLIGIGGSVLAGVAEGRCDDERKNQIFTISVILSVVLAAVLTVIFIVFQRRILMLFGADDELVEYALKYMKWVAIATPAFLIAQVLAAFVRLDNAPFVATIAVLVGGATNTVGDITLVFTADMGIEGAGLATMVGQIIATVVLLVYFFTKKCNLHLKRPKDFVKSSLRIVRTGFAPFIIDCSLGIVVIVFNNEIAKKLGVNELAVYGAVANITILVQALFYGVGQALQPIVSSNFGAGKTDRVRKVELMSLLTAAAMGLLFVSVAMLAPTPILNLFMSTTDEVLAVGPRIVRIYSVSYLLMGVNIAAGYYLQSVLKTNQSFVVSLLRGFVLCIIGIFVLPLIFGLDNIWWATPISELLTFVVAMIFLFAGKNKQREIK